MFQLVEVWIIRFAITAPQPTQIVSPDSGSTTYVEAQRMGDGWEVRRNDGTSLRIDLELEDGRSAVALSPDGRWLSYA